MIEDDHHTTSAPHGIVLAQAARPEEESQIWLVHSGRALPLRDWEGQWTCARFTSLTALIRQWDAHHRELRRLTESPLAAATIDQSGVPVESLQLDAPFQPTQVFCTIGNYKQQVIEAAVDGGDPDDAEELRTATAAALQTRHRDGSPYVCLTSTGRVGAPDGELVLAPGMATLDWEVEIGVVIGASGSQLKPAETGAFIAGYCVVNDLTIRASVLRDDLPVLGSDWLQCKGLPGSLPVGPWFVPAWQVPDHSGLRLQLSLNGSLMQDDTADDMLFNVPEQLSYLSHHTRLQAGDLVCTGSPAGFGIHYGRFLRAGDTVHASVTGLGTQTTRFINTVQLPNPSHSDSAASVRTTAKEHTL